MKKIIRNIFIPFIVIGAVTLGAYAYISKVTAPPPSPALEKSEPLPQEPAPSNGKIIQGQGISVPPRPELQENSAAAPVDQQKTHHIILRIDYRDDTIQNTEIITSDFVSGENLWDVMERAFKKQGIPVTTVQYGENLGIFIESIGGKKNGSQGRFWQYYVNGSYATVGASSYTVKNGDIIEWKFLNNKET